MNNTAAFWTFAGIFVSLFAIVFIISLYNSIIRLKNNIEKAFANIDVLLKQRFDELPNIIATVKGYAKYEKGVLQEITRLRTVPTSSLAEKAAASQALSGVFKTVFAVAENYPKLMANEQFLALQKRISELEDNIADRREFYNDSVNTYNTRIEQFPYNIFAKTFSYTRKELFTADANEKKPISV